MFNSTHQIVIASILACGGLIAFVNCQDKIKAGFLLFIGTLGLGYRTLTITRGLKLHPAEFVIWAVLILILARNTPRRGERQPSLPWWIWSLMPFWIYAWLQASSNWATLDLQFAEFRDFLHLIPIFLVTASVLRGARGATYAPRQQGRPVSATATRGAEMNLKGESERQGAWRLVILALFMVSTGIAFMGVLERFFPGALRLVPGLTTVRELRPGEEEVFHRAAFSVWGGPAAAFICGLIIPMTLLVLRWWPRPNQRIYTYGAFFLQLAAIYIAGWRSLWLFTGVQFLLFIVVKKRFALGVAVFLGVLLFYGVVVPSRVQERLQTLFAVLEGKPIDTSGEQRWKRATDAMSSIEENPLGKGWASAGWVHSDVLQIACNQGIIAGIIFVTGYLTTLGSLVKRWKKTPAGIDADIGLALLLTFVEVGGILLFEGVEVLPQLIFPVWVGWALVDTWLNQQQTTRPLALSRGVDRRQWIRQQPYRPRSLNLSVGV